MENGRLLRWWSLWLFYNVKTRGRKCLTYDVVTVKAKIITYTISLILCSFQLIGRYLWSVGGQTQLTSLLIFSLLYGIIQIDSLLLRVCWVTDHRRYQNGVRMHTFCSYHILTASVIYYCTATWNLLVNYIMNSVLCAFWLVLSYDLWMNRRIDDDRWFKFDSCMISLNHIGHCPT